MDTDPGNQILQRHLDVCGRFGDAVLAADGRWDWPSPCDEWNAQGILEHTIGFHDLLLLRPFGLKPHRPKGDPKVRWEMTVRALEELFRRPGLLEGSIEVPAIGSSAPTTIDVAPLVELLSRDVFIHTWDLARAVQAEDGLDPQLCALFLAEMPVGTTTMVTSGMFHPPVDIESDADVKARFLARVGRDPRWSSDEPEQSQDL